MFQENLQEVENVVQPAENIQNNMSSEHIETRKKLKEICEVKVFETLLDNCTLSDIEKTIVRMHYLKGNDFRYIGDSLGFAESTIKKKHKRILQKLNKLL